jgi:hypothetical protein
MGLTGPNASQGIKGQNLERFPLSVRILFEKFDDHRSQLLSCDTLRNTGAEVVVTDVRGIPLERFDLSKANPDLKRVIGIWLGTGGSNPTARK